jgi:hypothetical protein
VGGLSPALNLSISTSEPHPLGKMSNPAGGSAAEAGAPTGDAAAEPQHPWCRSALAVGLT